MHLLSSDFTVEGWAFSRAAGGKRINLLEREDVEEAYYRFQPDIVVHSAAERRPDKMENYPEQSWELNVGVPERIARLCSISSARLIFISTDYVFDGTSPPYSENSEINPLNFYGKSKAEAEKVIQEICPESYILRVPILYGPSSDMDESAVTVLLKQLKKPEKPETGEVFFDDAAIRYPTLTTDVAKAILFLIQRNEHGIFHYTAEEPFTKYGMAVLMASLLKIEDNQIYPDAHPQTGARRPLNAHLNNTKIRRLGFSCYTPFRDGIASVIKGF